MNSFEATQIFQRMIGVGLIALTAMLMGAMLARDLFALVFLFGLGIWIMLLPYHARLATHIAVGTFGSALIIPFPGRPFWWEIGAIMGWTGLLLVVALREYAKDAADMFRRHFWIFLGIAIYCGTLIVIMRLRGVGFRALGGDQLGGRLYIQQLLCAVFPLLFVARPPQERQLVTLFVLQSVLSVTFLISDFVFSYGGTSLFGLLYFFELPNDGFNFETQSAQMGIRRFQSLYFLSHGMLSILFIYFNLDGLTRFRTIWMWPVSVGLLAIGALSGHRYLLIVLAIQMPIYAWSQRFVTFRRFVSAAPGALILLILTYTFARNLPDAAQRTVSLLPGIEVSRVARMDGEVTWEGRRELRRLGWELAPNYYLLGRGFAKNDLPASANPAVAQLNPDTFYNGFIGLLVSTGIPGTTGMMILLVAGNLLAIRILRTLRRMEFNDNFLRLTALQAGFFVAQTIIFLGFHGDAEFALRAFGLPVATLMVCERHLRIRLASSETAPVRWQEQPFRRRDGAGVGLPPAAAGASAS